MRNLERRLGASQRQRGIRTKVGRGDEAARLDTSLCGSDTWTTGMAACASTHSRIPSGVQERKGCFYFVRDPGAFLLATGNSLTLADDGNKVLIDAEFKIISFQ